MLTSANAPVLVSPNKGLSKILQVSVLVSHLNGRTQRGVHCALTSDTFANRKTIIIAISENNRFMMWDILMEIILALTLCKVQFQPIIKLCQSCF